MKRHTAGLASYYRECNLLPRLASLPVPGVLPGSRPGELRLTHIEGIGGDQFIEQVSPGDLLREMGRFLRLLHSIKPATVAAILPGEGRVLVHGDFAHYNCLMDPGESHLAAVLDWEEAHLGDEVEDVAWCERQFRNRYPQHAWAVSNLFEGFGAEPDWELREQAVTARLEYLKESAGLRTPKLEDHFGIVRFHDKEQMSAFVAALSRFLTGPRGQSNETNMPAKVWQRLAAADPPELQLNDAALNASAAAFGHIRLSGIVNGKQATETRLVLDSEALAAWGYEEAGLRLAT